MQPCDQEGAAQRVRIASGLREANKWGSEPTMRPLEKGKYKPIGNLNSILPLIRQAVMVNCASLVSLGALGGGCVAHNNRTALWTDKAC